MRTTRITVNLLLAAALLAACSDRNALTTPSARPVAATAALVDRPYTWSFTCHGGFVLGAQWSWTENDVAIASGSAGCSGDQNLSGTGVRPANANGFTAQVGYDSKSWTFDPAGPFKASLSGSVAGGGCHRVLVCFDKESGKLTVDS